MSLTASTHRASKLVLLVSVLVGLNGGLVQAVQARDSEPELLLLEVRLDQAVLSTAIPAYDVDGHILLPLGELARLLTIAIQTNPRDGTASGFVLSEDRGFSLNFTQARVTRAGVSEQFDPGRLLAEPDDLYVAEALLERWLPLDLEVDRARLLLRVQALEALPLQSRLKRGQLGEQAAARGGDRNPGFPAHPLPYRLMSLPFVDQSLTTEVRRDDSGTHSEMRYSAFLTGDALGMESSVYLTGRQADESLKVRATLGRHDPDGGLLGPLKARSFQFGSVAAPSVENVMRGVSGEGVTVSNRPLTQPTSFDRQTFEGDLPPGWDVELYYNDALVDFQRARDDGQYRFEDQPLAYGRNDFRLVFHGPLGQTRVEQSRYSLDQSMVRPGEIQYTLTGHRGDDGQPRSVGQVDLGVSRHLSAMAGFVSAPVGDTRQQFARVGLRTFLRRLSLSADLITSGDGGTLAELGLQTRLGGMAVDAGRIRLDDFRSEVFPEWGDPLRTRDHVRLTGAILAGTRSALPVTLEAKRDTRISGATSTDISARISAYIRRTAFTNNLRWHSSGDSEHTSGSFLISRRVGDTSVRAQVDYQPNSASGVTALALSTDHALAEGYRLSLSAARTIATQEMRYSAGFTRTLGRYGLGLNASYASNGEMAVAAQLSVAMGRDPKRSDWLLDAVPMSTGGAASVLIFLDNNNNGLMDHGESPLQGVGFTVNGGRHQARTDRSGVAYIDRLPIRQHVDLRVDTGTLEDPQWAPQVAGLTLVPRPGRVAEIQVPVRMTSEIDGTVYLYADGATRGVGDLQLQLLNGRHELVAETSSSWDGFYIVPDVPAGDYWVRVSPTQLKRLGFTDTGMRGVTVSEDGAFVSGIDLGVRSITRKRATAGEHHPVASDPESPVQSSRFRADAWVRQQQAEYFAVQLMAASREVTVQEYIERNHLQQRAAYVRTTHRDSPWYVVIYGNYARYSDALAALKGLPPELAEASPWLRRYGEIQDELAVAP